GQAGKDRLTVEQVLSHQSGLSGLRGPLDPDIWFDWDAVAQQLEIAEPLWPPGTASGYEPMTFGYLAGELFRRADGRTLGHALQDELCAPLGLEFWIGLPEHEDPRVCQVQRPPAMPDLGALNEAKRLAFLEPWSSVASRDVRRWRAMESPGANGHGTALALARAMAVLACDGEVDGREILPHGVALEAAASRVSGPDQALPLALRWCAAFPLMAGVGSFPLTAQSLGVS